MTDKNIETADFTSSEKQVRFSMTTIRTPPSSPKPPNSRENSKENRKPSTLAKDLVPLSYVNKPRSTKTVKESQIDDIVPEITKHLKSNIDSIENIKVNFLEKLEVLPESKA